MKRIFPGGRLVLGIAVSLMAGCIGGADLAPGESSEEEIDTADLAVIAPAPAKKLWAKRFGTPGYNDDAYGNEYLVDLAIDGADNVVVLGHAAGGIDLGGGLLPATSGYDIYLAKLDKYGEHIWSKSFGNDAYHMAVDVALDGASNIVLLTMFSSGTIDFGTGPFTPPPWRYDYAVAKFNGDGDVLWAKQFEIGSDYASARLAVDASGNVFLGGSFEGTVDLGSGPVTSAFHGSPFLLKLDPNGNQLWSKTWTSFTYGNGFSVAASASGDVALMGWFYNGSLDFGCGPEVTTGDESFVVKLDGAGNCLWDTYTPGYVASSELVTDADGNVISTDRGASLVKYDGATGAQLWSRGIPNAGAPNSGDVTVDDDGNVVLTGSFIGSADYGTGPFTSNGDIDVAVAKYAPDGTPIWVRSAGNNHWQRGNAVAIDAGGRPVIGGNFEGSISWSGTKLVREGNGQDVFLAKIKK